MKPQPITYPPCDCAATRAALRIGIVQNAQNDQALIALQTAIENEDAVCIIGCWAQESMGESPANSTMAAPGGWAAIIQMILQNLPAIIALIESLINPPKPTPSLPTGNG